MECPDYRTPALFTVESFRKAAAVDFLNQALIDKRFGVAFLNFLNRSQGRIRRGQTLGPS
jgi:hypothetical protein